MVKLKKYAVGLITIVLLLTVSHSCKTTTYQVTKIEGRKIPINEKLAGSSAIEEVIAPYRLNIEKELNTVLSYSPETLDKAQGEWQTALGNLMADAALSKGNEVLKKKNIREADMSILNFGGIRSIIPKGNVTTRTAFEIMPFENEIVAVELSSDKISEMINYFIAEKKAHPLSGISFTINGKQAEDVKINGETLQSGRNYLVITSDYLLNGGDNMTFFANPVKIFPLDYKLRNVLIDYWKQTDTIKADRSIRIRKK